MSFDELRFSAAMKTTQILLEIIYEIDWEEFELEVDARKRPSIFEASEYDNFDRAIRKFGEIKSISEKLLAQEKRIMDKLKDANKN